MKRPVLSFYIHAVTISLKDKFLIVKVGKSSTDHIMAPISTFLTTTLQKFSGCYVKTEGVS